MNDGGAGWIRFGGNALFFLLALVILLDPTNTVLHLKNPVFVLLVGYSIVFFKPDFSFLPHILLIFATIILSYIFAEMQMNSMDMEVVSGAIKGFSPLVLLLWIRQYDVLRLVVVPALITSLLIDVLYVMATGSELVEMALYTFVWSHDDMIMMSRRSFLGFSTFGMYYKSILCVVFVMLLFFQRSLMPGRQRWLSLAASAVLAMSLLISGTRLPMLLPFMILGIAVYTRLRDSRWAKYVFYPLVACGVLLLAAFVVMLAAEQGEYSNKIKGAHLLSYVKLFENNPLYLLTGQGPGTSFFSEGFHRMTTATEWTYIELVRCYGVLSLVIVGVMVWPLRMLWPHRHDSRVLAMMLAYAVYLVIAGTNPLLVSSTGMLIVLTMYAYAVRAVENPELADFTRLQRKGKNRGAAGCRPAVNS